MGKLEQVNDLPDGVHLGLPEVDYFRQKALGTTDQSRLWRFREGWWWLSPNYPFYKPPKSEATAFGSATHALFLEGREVFEARFSVEPSPLHYPELLVTVDDLKSALAAIEAPSLARNASKADLVELAKVYLPGRHIWEDILAKWRAKLKGREALSYEESWKLEVMYRAAMADHLMAAVVTAGQGIRLVEVSVFWTLSNGIRLRFRFDSLLPPMVADLKTLGNVYSEDLAMAVGKAIGRDALDIQAAMSFTARRKAYEFITAGKVFGGTPEQRAWLARFPTEAPIAVNNRPAWSWLWMFYQKAEGSSAPTIFPLRMHFGSTQHRDGFRKAAIGLQFYADQVARVGLDEPWTRVDPVHDMTETAEHRVVIPHWYPQPPAVAGEEEQLTWLA